MRYFSYLIATFLILLTLSLIGLWFLHSDIREKSPDHETVTFTTIKQTENTRATQRNTRNETRAVIPEAIPNHKPENLLTTVNIAVNSMNQELRESSLSTFKDRDFLSDPDTMNGYRPIRSLVDRILTEPDPDTRIALLEQLTELCQELPLKLLNHALENPDPRIHEQANVLVNKLNIEEIFKAVKTAARDENPEVQQAALETVETLSELQEYSPTGLLVEIAMTDPQPKLRMIALELLAEAGQEVALEPLNQALNDPAPEVSELALDLITEFEENWQG